MPSANTIPSLKERIPQGPRAADEFERLMRVLLGLPSQERGRGLSGDTPYLVLREGELHGLEGPLVFDFQWSLDPKYSLPARPFLEDASRPVRNWIIVTPEELPPSRQQKLAKLSRPQTQVHCWDKGKIEHLLWAQPALWVRYYPDFPHPSLPDHKGFRFRDFAQKYREGVAFYYRRHRLLGLPPTTLQQKDLQAQVELQALFVPLLLKRDEDGAQPQALAHFLNARTNNVVLGDPGMGKSMLLTFLALLFSGGAQLQGFEAPAHALPFFISLRDLVHEYQKGRVQSWIDYLRLRAQSDLHLQDAHMAFFEAALRMGEAVLLIDGLDEVGGNLARGSLAEVIVSLEEAFGDCPIWVSSRIYGYTDRAVLPQERFDCSRIQKLDDAQIQDFLGRWYGIQLPEQSREREDRRKSLEEAVFRTPSVRRLAGNPLLLTLMAFIHRATGDLPHDRAELYNQCIEMLLRTWQDARRGSAGELEAHPFEALDMRLEEQKDYLAHLALYIQEQNEGKGEDEEARGLIDKRSALDCLAERHFVVAQRQRPHIGRMQARKEMEDFLGYMGDRTGLLLDRGGDKLSFIHLSFQEYLAAWVFLCQDDRSPHADFFEGHLGHPAWEEVLLLRLYLLSWTPGMGEKPFDEVMEALLRRLEREELPQGWLTLTRALREKLRFREEHWKKIIERGFWYWLKSPKLSGEWFGVLEEVKLFSDKPAQALRELLAGKQRKGGGFEAVAALHLEAKLFGLSGDAAGRFAGREDLNSLLCDLIAFMGDEEFARLLAKECSVEHWLNALDVLGKVDGSRLYGITLGWATGVSPCSVNGDAALEGAALWMQAKIGEEAKSRRAFEEGHREGDAKALFEQSGEMRLVGRHDFYTLSTPLAFALLYKKALNTAPWPRQAPLHPELLAERFFESHGGSLALEGALTISTRQWLEEWIRNFPSSMPIPGEAIGRLAGKFGHFFVSEFRREFLREFRREFRREFFRDFGHFFVRDFVLYFVRDFARYFVSEFRRDFRRDFFRDFVREFFREFFRDFVRDFGRYFVREMGLDPEAEDAERQFEVAIQDEKKLLWLLTQEAFWDWLFFYSSPSFEGLLDHGPETPSAHPKNPFAIPLLLCDRFTLAAVHQGFCLGRYFSIAFPDGKVPDAEIELWLQRHPLDVHPVAWDWQEHAKMLAQKLQRLQGPQGALAMAHANYAYLMTGIKLDAMGTPWKKLLDERDSSADAPIGLQTKPSPKTKGKNDKKTVNEAELLFTWLHLSDIHLGNPDARHRNDRALLLDSLRKDMRDYEKFGLDRIDALFVTGDIAWSGKAEQYQEAEGTLLELGSIVGLKPSQIFLVPGNHDVDRDVDKDRDIKRLLGALRGGLDALDDALGHEGDRAKLKKRQEAYLSFASKYAPFCLPSFVSMGHGLYWRHLLKARGGLQVRLIGLNSALLAADDQDRGKLWLGKEPWAKTLGDAEDLVEEELVIVLSHHPFLDGWLCDQKDADFEAKSRAHMHLCGHVHEHESNGCWAGSGKGNVRVVAGAVHGDKNAPPEHGYGFGAIVKDEDAGKGFVARVYPRRWSDKNREFRKDIDHLPKDSPLFYAELQIPRLGRS